MVFNIRSFTCKRYIAFIYIVSLKLLMYSACDVEQQAVIINILKLLACLIVCLFGVKADLDIHCPEVKVL